MNHKTISSGHGTVHYWIQGDGIECVVFTHGATMDHGLFRHQMDYFSHAYRAISWDAPAHGLSKPYESFSLQNAARDLVNILDAEGIEKAHLVGQSMGGYISQIAALDYPERVHSIIAVDSSPIQPSFYSALDNWLLSITPPLIRLYPFDALVNIISDQIAASNEGKKYALETLTKHTKGEIIEIMAGVYRGLQVYDRNFRLPCPILIVYGDRDRTGKVQAYSRAWAALESREVKIVPNAAHNANMDNPDAFNTISEEFLKKLHKP